jgi:uncharacterized protein YcbX
MDLEERIQMHEQWLSSMESSHVQLVEDLDRVAEELDSLKQHLANVQKTFADQMVVLAMNQAAFMGSQARLTEDQIKLQQELRDLRDVVDRYIRFRGNGNQAPN